MYWNRTSNALGNTGDGTAAVLRAGLPLKDMEFVQFHPTGLRRTGILITEGARGEGGYLINKDGERFMKKYAPEKMELAPRDIVARSIEREILEGRGCGPEGDYICLDLRHLGEKKLMERLPQTVEHARVYEGVDPVKEPIPIRPTAHYSMGGIDTDKYGQTEIKGLYAAGEAACISVHGANRLGGNSLLDILVFGKIAAEHAAEYVAGVEHLPTEGNEYVKKEEEFIKSLMNKEAKENLSKLRKEMGNIMASKVGIFREEKPMVEALNQIRELKERAQKGLAVVDTSKRFNVNLIQTLEFLNLLDLAEVTALCAIERKESRGAHYRLDYPQRDDENFLKHSIVRKNEDGSLSHGWKEVVITKWQPQERKY
jgi:succinate dehydrogenase/fumarate reductase flavoprotein subunit